MSELLTAAQMREIEATGISAGVATGLQLMERAGAGVVEAILAQWPEFRAGAFRGIVLCGPGNNGGDGYVVARLLRDLGWRVEVCALGAPVTPDAQAARAAWAAWGGAVRAPKDMDWPDFQTTQVVVDAMFGTGLVRDVAPGVWGLLEMAKASHCKLVAVDILSGICADSGRVRAEGGYLEWPADLTVTFECAKRGHHLDHGAVMGGPLVVVPLGLELQMIEFKRPEPEALVELVWVLEERLRKAGGHKYGYGHAVVVAGGVGRGGAARLAARAALRVGAGLVTVNCAPEAVAENAARLDAVMLNADALAEMLADDRVNALCIGPGLGLGAREAALLGVALRVGNHRPTVLDADALTLIARDPALFAALHKRCVLTPHAGEFARLFPDIAERLAAVPAPGAVAYSKVDATRDAAKRAGCVVLFKGSDTVVASASGRCFVHSAAYARAAPWLATAGSGDVLAGLICGLLARGVWTLTAACMAASLHVDCALEFGPGLIAEDLPDMLPRVFRGMQL